MPQDGALAEDIVGKLNGTHRAPKGINATKVLIWDSVECMDQFRDLVAHPPLHSVVVHIDPVMAKAILKASNDRNRPISNGSVRILMDAHENDDFGFTGDTLKFSRKGRLLDGQYRLTACVQANKGFQTHVVFGLDEAVFDILDRQRTRTPGDILAICGFKDATIIAGATRWVLMMENQARGKTSRGMNPRRIRELAEGSMKGLAHYTRSAEAVRQAYKIPPTICAALLFMISRGNKALVDSFVQDWLHGNRNYTRNKVFDVLVSRMQSVRAQNNGAMNRTVLAAMLVQTFNYWNANVLATPKALTWVKQWQFPLLAFDKEAFQASLERRKTSDASLPALEDRMLKALLSLRDKDGNIELPVKDLARASSMDDRHVNYVLGVLADKKLVHCSRKTQKGKHNMPAIWRLKDAGEAKAKAQ